MAEPNPHASGQSAHALVEQALALSVQDAVAFARSLETIAVAATSAAWSKALDEGDKDALEVARDAASAVSSAHQLLEQRTKAYELFRAKVESRSSE